MTTRELYKAVIAHINGETLPYGLTEGELREGFESLIAKLDARNEKARTKPRKADPAVEARKNVIAEFITGTDGEFTADEIAELTGLTAPQVAFAMRAHVSAGIVTKGTRKIDSKHSKVTYVIGA